MKLSSVLIMCRTALHTAGLVVVSGGYMSGATWEILSGVIVMLVAGLFSIGTGTKLKINIEGKDNDDDKSGTTPDGRGGYVPKSNSRVDTKSGKFLSSLAPACC